MKTKIRRFEVRITASKNYQSVNLTEGFEVEVDDQFNELEFEAEKQRLKDKLSAETKTFLTKFVEERQFDDSMDIR